MYLSKEKKVEIFGQYGKAQKAEDTGSAEKPDCIVYLSH